DIQLSVKTFNTRGLREFKKRKKVANWINEKKIDVVYLQETHSTPPDEPFWSSQFRGKCWFSHGTNAAFVKGRNICDYVRLIDEIYQYTKDSNLAALLIAIDFEKAFDTLGVLIHEVLAIEVWKANVFTVITRMNFEPKTTFPLYMTLYHEATLVSFLETILFYRETCEAAEEIILDLIDYCYRRITHLIAKQEAGELEDNVRKDRVSDSSTNNLEELKHQENTINFDVCIKSISILRYITDHLSGIPLSGLTRMLNTHDVPGLLVQLMENPPWSRMQE
ncbi:zinc finger MYND domain-containing protein 10-like, partial [Saccoglossus kowalevskii]|uniref:Zinc finger MYND domain-containing protein 10-like n=1 Tax=Saccoglossus kowalevskii TaxID=10224 RepID=A0ABM0MRW4_SACKO